MIVYVLLFWLLLRVVVLVLVVVLDALVRSPGRNRLRCDVKVAWVSICVFV